MSDEFVPHPADVILRELDQRGWSQRDLAEILNRPVQVINELVKRRKPVTVRMSCALEDAFGVPAQF